MTQVATAEQPYAHEMQLAYRYPADEVVKMLDSDATKGLTAAKAQQHLQRSGANALPEPAAPPAWRKLLSQFKGPLTVLLLLAMGVSVFAWLNERDTPIPFGESTPVEKNAAVIEQEAGLG